MNVSAKSLARDKVALPLLLSRSPAALFRLVAFLSSDVIGMPVSSIGPLVRRSHCVRVLDATCPVPAALETDTEVDSTQITEVDSIRSPDAVYGTMRANARLLKSIGIQNLPRLVSAFPDALLLDSQQILPVVAFLRMELRIPYRDVPKVLQSFPQLLGTPLEDMQCVVSYLLDLEISPATLAKLSRAFPSILSLDVDANMKPAVEFLRDIGVKNIARFITRLPPVLGYGREELETKYAYLRGVCDARFQVVRFPAVFSYPLERVVKA